MLVVAVKAAQAVASGDLEIEPDLARLIIEVVKAEHCGIPPGVEDRKHLAATGGQDPPITRTDLGAFLSNPDHLDHPPQQRRRAAKLLLDIDGVEGIGAL